MLIPEVFSGLSFDRLHSLLFGWHDGDGTEERREETFATQFILINLGLGIMSALS
jgi:hypothetical protein